MGAHHRRPPSAWGLCGLICLVLAACGGQSQQVTSPAGSPTGSVPVLHASIMLSGTTSLSYTYTAPRGGYRSCADVAVLRTVAGDRPGDFSLPVPLDRPTASGHALTIAAVISPYRGPGHYGTADVAEDDTLIALDDPRKAFYLTPSSTADGTVSADGSGRMALTDLENSDHQRLSAVIAWTCAQ